MKNPTKWYAGGLCFECTRCGKCCSGPDEGFVWVTETEIRTLAERLALSLDEFGRKYLRMVDGRYCLIEKPDHDCVFLDRQKGCTVYEDRPTQCRTFPFWEEHVATKRAWRDLAQECPGVGKGERFGQREIDQRVDETDRGWR